MGLTVRWGVGRWNGDGWCCSLASAAWVSRRACTLHVSLICLWACRTNAANNADCRFDCCTSTIHAAVKFSLIGDGRWPTHSHRDQSFGFRRPFSIVYTTSQDDTTLQHSAMQNSWVASQNVQHIKRAQHNATRENTIHMCCVQSMRHRMTAQHCVWSARQHNPLQIETAQ